MKVFTEGNLLCTISMLLIFTLINNARGQNLVPNPSFEADTTCPQERSGWYRADEIKDTPPWRMATYGTSDYFNECSVGTTVGVPFNFAGNGSSGFQYARTGNAYVGVATKVGVDYREYICAPLISAFTTGTKYYVSMYINCPNSGIPSDRIGVYLSYNYPDTSGVGSQHIPVMPQIENPTGNLLSDTLNWVQIAGWYTALGGENYVTIGNFSPDSMTLGVGGFYQSYYYIDDVCISTDSSVCIQQESGIKQKIISNTLNIFPNPANSVIQVTVNNNPNIEIKILNLLGNQLLETNQKEIDVSTLTNGVYYLSAKSKEGFYTKKFIICHY